MKLSDDVIASINENGVDVSSAWMWADADIYNIGYGAVLAQPVSVEAATLNDFRFLAETGTITVRQTIDPDSRVVWSGYVEMVSDPAGDVPETVAVDHVTIDWNTNNELEVKAGGITADKIADGTITDVKLADMPAGMVKGRAVGAGTGPVTNLSTDEVHTIIGRGVANGVASLNADGKVPRSESQEHNNLSGIQGGAAGDYQHLTTAQVTSFTNKPTSVFGRTGDVVAVAGDYNTSLVPEGTNLYYTNSRADARITLQKGVAGGIASLDVGGKVPISQIPASAITETFVVASEAAMLALTAQRGDVAVRTDNHTSYILQADPASTRVNWVELLSPADGVTSVGLSAPSGFTVSGSPVTNSGTLSFAWNGTSSNFVRADGSTVATSSYLSAAGNPDLVAIEALAGTSGLLKKTAANTWTLDTNTYLTGNQTITLSGEASGAGATSINVTLSNSSVIGKVLTGYTATSGTISATDTILQAIQKLGFDKHVAVTIGTANGLSLSGQAISLGLASTSTTGALSSTNWNTFNNKQAGSSILTSISALTTGTGLLKLTNGVASLDTNSYLTGNQTITLTGIVTGSGTTAITTAIADGALSIAKTSGLQTALDGKQPLDADLTAISALTTTGFARRTAANTWSASGIVWADVSGLVGTTATSFCVGNDSRLSNARTPTAHVLDSATHTISGKTAGQALIATGATTFAFTTISGDATLSGTGAVTLANTAVTAGSYGSSTQVGTITVDSKGRITGASNTAIAFPVTSVFGRTGAVVAASGDYTTTQVTEGTNQYFTNARVRGTDLAGYAVGSNTALAATDTVLSAFGKVQAQINARPGTVTSVGLSATGPLSVSGSPITSSGTLALGWSGSSSNLVRADGSTLAASTFQAALGYTPVNKSGDSGIAALTFSDNIYFANPTNGTYRGIQGTMGANDQWRIMGRANADNVGFLEIATSDDGTEPIYVRQYNAGAFGTLVRSASLLDGSGNTSFPGSVTAGNGFVGNASTATKLATARTLTVGSTGKTFDGSANVSWTLAEIGAQPAGSYLTASALASVNYGTTFESTDPFTGTNRGTYDGKGGVRTWHGAGPFGTVWYNVVDVRHRNAWNTNDVFGGELAWGMTAYTDRLAFRSRSSTGVPSAWSEVAVLGKDVSFNTINTTSNNAGNNIKIGDDAWIGDQYVTNGVVIKGQADATQGYIKFGNSAYSFGYNGSELVYNGNRVLSAADVTALNIPYYNGTSGLASDNSFRLSSSGGSITELHLGSSANVQTFLSLYGNFTTIINFDVGNALRFQVGATPTAFAIDALDASGTYIDTPMSIGNDASAYVTFNRNVIAPYFQAASAFLGAISGSSISVFGEVSGDIVAERLRYQNGTGTDGVVFDVNGSGGQSLPTGQPTGTVLVYAGQMNIQTDTITIPSGEALWYRSQAGGSSRVVGPSSISVNRQCITVIKFANEWRVNGLLYV